MVLGRHPAGKILLSFGILMAKVTVTKVLLVLKHVGISVYNARTYFVYQSKFLFPAILTYWERHRSKLVNQINKRERLFGVEMAYLTPWDTLQNMERTQCSVVQLLRLYILSWFRYISSISINIDTKNPPVFPARIKI